MKVTAVLCLALASLASIYAQEDPGPSPTESVGCEPHGDHWHCEGPATTVVTSEAEDPGPSPTDSVGCEPHGDHWHCEGPATTLVTSETVDPGPSPTESVGCKPHRDHWHCEGSAETDADAPESTGAAIPGATVGYAAGALGLAAVLLNIGI